MPDQLTIRVLAGSLGGGAGSHVYNRELIRRLAARGHRLSVVAFDGGDSVADVADVVELPLRGFSQAPAVWPLATGLEHAYLGLRFARRDWQKADVVIGAEHLFIRAHARKLPSTPLVYLPHSLVVAHEIDGYQLPERMARFTKGVYRRVQQWAIEHAAVTLRFTKMACDVLAAAYPDLTVRRFAVNPIGVDLPSRTRANGRSGEVRLLYVGQLIPRKRVELILAALHKAPTDHWSLDIVGDGPSRASLERQAGELGLRGRVRFHGFQLDPAKWYCQADLLLLTSQSESLGMVLLEAMSHGVPCMAFLDDGKTFFNVNREIIDHRRTGILVDGERGFERELAAVLSNPSMLDGLGETARKAIGARWTWDAHLTRYEQLFEELVSCSSSKTRPPRLVQSA